MALLIDGYNLLHASGIFGKARGASGFQASREALLQFLSASIEPAERRQTTVVFDASQAPPGLSRTVSHDDMTVRYASGYPDADTLIEELIAVHAAPRSLLVVSSDHRIQRAAQRRKARFVDSDRWCGELWRQRADAHRAAGKAIPEKPQRDLTPAEIDYWVQQFAVESPDTPTGGAQQPSSTGSDAEERQSPFPPGYGEDLLE